MVLSRAGERAGAWHDYRPELSPVPEEADGQEWEALYQNNWSAARACHGVRHRRRRRRSLRRATPARTIAEPAANATTWYNASAHRCKDGGAEGMRGAVGSCRRRQFARAPAARDVVAGVAVRLATRHRAEMVFRA